MKQKDPYEHYFTSIKMLIHYAIKIFAYIEKDMVRMSFHIKKFNV